MKKILIYLNKDELAPTGGPKGYNYNLMLGLQKIDTENLEIRYIEKSNSVIGQANNRIKNIKSRIIKNTILALKSILNKGLLMYGPNHKASINLNDYDIVHFHRTIDLYRVKDSLKEYKGKVILTSHTPTKPRNEIFDLLTDFEKRYMRWFYKRLDEIDLFAFNRADYIVFPCEEAEEPYVHTWLGYEEFHECNKEKYRYFPTGTSVKEAKLSSKDIRDRYDIPEDAIVISYVGRHNYIKGYGDLKLIGERLLKKHSNLYFLIAGNEEPIKGLEHPNWIEIGWTNDAGSLINASDIFILPNKETYFDLVLLEVLSLGQAVLASETGGNKYFKQFSDSGIMLYDGIDQCIKKIEDFMALPQLERKNMGNKNKILYNKFFTNEVFAQHYFSLLKSIISETCGEQL